MFSRLRAEGLVPRIPDAEIVKALKGLRIPGRMEKVCEAPELYADGGHCPTAARALARTMAAHFAGQPAGLLVGMMQDKDHEAFFAALAAWPGWQWVWCYQGLSPRAQDPEALAQVARRHFHNTRVFHNLEQALQSLEGHAEKKIRIVATGSLYSIATLQEWGTRHGTARYQTEAPAQDDSVPDH
jgi:dihydrofolate synthase/folylpolyglutamate synthase